MRVLLVPNHEYAKARTAAYALSDWLEERGFESTIAPDYTEGTVVDVTDVGLVIALGGDGTVLRAGRIIGMAQIPLLGIRFGNLGFLTALDHEEDYYSFIEDALAGEVHITPRSLVEARVYYVSAEGEHGEETFLSLNDIAISRGDSGRVIPFKLGINGLRVACMRGDGIVVSSATGSTGYALSAGGPVVSPGFRGLIVVPVAPHTLMSRPLLTDPSDVVELDLTERSDTEKMVYMDGVLVDVPGTIQRIEIRRAAADLPLISYDEHGFYRTASKVFFGIDHAR